MGWKGPPGDLPFEPAMGWKGPPGDLPFEPSLEPPAVRGTACMTTGAGAGASSSQLLRVRCTDDVPL